MAGKFIDVTLRLIDKMTGPLNKAGSKLADCSRQWQRAGADIQKTGKAVSNVGAGLSKRITAPVAGAGLACVKLAADFEKGMSTVQSISGATGAEMSKLSDKAKEMGAKTKFSASEATDAFKYMGMAGWKTKDMMSGIEGSMYLAGATGEELGRTADILTDNLENFNMKASEANKFVDILAQTANNANTDVGRMGKTFEYVAPVAKALKFSAGDTATAIGLMASASVKGSKAGTALRSWFANMSAPTKTMKKTMDSMGLSLTDQNGKMKDLGTIMKDTRRAFSKMSEAEKVMTAKTLAGKNGMAGFMAIVNASDKKFNQLSKSVENSAGACKKMYDVANDNLYGQVTELKSKTESLAIAFGERLTPYVKRLVGFVQKLTDKFNGMNDKQKDMVIKVAGIVAAIGPALLIFGKLTTGVGKAVSMVGKIGGAFKKFGSIAGILRSPAGIVIGLIAAIAGAAFLIYKNWDKVGPYFKGVAKMFQKSFGGAGGVVETFKKTFSNVMKSLGKAAKALMPVITNAVVPLIGKLAKVIKKLVPVVAEMVGKLLKSLAPVLKKVAGLIADLAPVVADVLVDAFKALSPVIDALVDLIKDLAPVISDIVKKVLDALLPVIKDVMKVLKDILPVVGNALKNAIKAVSPVIKTLGNLIKKLAPVISKLLGKAFKALAPVLKTAAKLFGKVANVIGKTLGKVIEKMSPILKKMGKVFQKVFDKVAEIVEKVVGKIKPLFEKISPIVETVMDGIGKAVSITFDTIGNVIETVADHIGDIMDSVAKVFGGVIDFLTGVFTGNWKKAWDGIVSIFKGIFNIIPATVETVLNLAISVINKMIGGLNIVVDKIPGVGKIPEIPKVKLPRLARGTDNWTGGIVQVSERGGEIIDLPRGSRVYPHDKSVAMARDEGRREGIWAARMPIARVNAPAQTAALPQMREFGRLKATRRIQDVKFLKFPGMPQRAVPQLARGTDNWRGGIAQVSERGGEIIDLPRGSRVYPHDKSVAMARAGKAGRKEQKAGDTTVVINIPKLAESIIVREDADIDRIAKKISTELKRTSMNMGGADIGYIY